MSTLEAFEKYWEAGKFESAYAGGLLQVVKARMREAFYAGYGSGINDRIVDEENKASEPIRLRVETYTSKPGEAILEAILEDKDLYAVANRIKPWIKDWILTKVVVPATPPTTNDPKTPAMIRFTNAGGTFEKHFTPAKGWHWVRVNPPPADPKAVANAIQVDDQGLVKLSDADVKRIAQATVNHARAVEAEVAQRQLEHQKREMEERARLQEIVRTASEYAVGTRKQTQSQARVEIALEDVKKYFEALDTQSAGSRLPAWKDAVKSLIIAIRILNERK